MFIHPCKNIPAEFNLKYSRTRRAKGTLAYKPDALVREPS